jgi:hypothetical protein
VRIAQLPGSDPLAGAIVERNGRWVCERLLVVRLLGPNSELLDSIPFLVSADLVEIPQPRPLSFWQAPQ